MIRDPHSSHLSHTVNRTNRAEVMSAISQAVNYTMVIPSNYEKYLKNCQSKRTNFIDSEFPHTDRSVGVSVERRRIVWKRLPEVVKNAVMV